MAKGRTTYKQQYQKELRKLQRELSKPYYYGYDYSSLTKVPKKVGRKQLENIQSILKDVKKVGQRVKNIEMKGYDFWKTPVEVPKRLTRASASKLKEEYSSLNLYRQAQYYYGTEGESGNPYISGTQARAMERALSAKRGAETRRRNAIEKLIDEHPYLIKDRAKKIFDETGEEPLYFDDTGESHFRWYDEDVIEKGKQYYRDRLRQSRISDAREWLEDEEWERSKRLNKVAKEIVEEAGSLDSGETRRLVEESRLESELAKLAQYDETTIDEMLSAPSKYDGLRLDTETGELLTQEEFDRRKWARENGIDIETGEILSKEDKIQENIQILFDMLDSFDTSKLNTDSPYIIEKQLDYIDRLKQHFERIIQSTGAITAASNIEAYAGTIYDIVNRIMYASYNDSAYDAGADIITLENIITMA